LLQSTDTCKSKLPAYAGGHYEPTASPRRAEAAPHYNTVRMNRNDGPEDSSLPERCLTGGLPEFGIDTGSFRRIVQTPGGISMYYDVGQGQGWQRNIVMDGSPHLPPGIRQWFGDSRGHWDGNTLVVDVTNFTPKTDAFGSRENLHLIERWTRTGPTTLAYEVTVEDPTVWTRPWTVKQELGKQSDQENRIYTEPRCIEGNYGLPGLLHGRRVEEAAFAEGRGPDPTAIDNTNDGLLLLTERPPSDHCSNRPIIRGDDECRGISVREQPSAWIAQDLQPSICNIRGIRSLQSTIIQFPCSESYHFWKRACSVSSSRKSAPFPTAIRSR